MEMKKLPVGVQEFRVLREENSIYVDKTEGIHRIATGGNYYFLARPRRFGKSLLLSTLKELFQGNKGLFKGLWIEDKWDWTQTNPVLHISFAAAGIKEVGLTKAISNLLDREANLHKIEFTQKGNSEKFRELIEKVHAKHGRVVVLIDEYDKPIVDYLDNLDLLNEHKALLRDFYVVLKDTPQYLRFVFITGITKFSKINVFSALNHLKDISLNDDYATLLGYTQQELEQHFEPYMPLAAAKNEMNRAELLAELKHWYNGYSWDGITKVYNPFSILNFFAANDFRNYWFTTGTPSWLTVLARQKEFYDMDEIETDETAFDTFEVENLDPQAVMFQAGYLTIKKYDRKSHIYTLGYPNTEVRKSFLAFMIEAYACTIINKIPPTFIKVQRALERKDIKEFVELLNTMFANIPYQIWDGQSEKYFHSLVHLMLHYLGTNIQSEINTSKGRIDAVIETINYNYIVEFKFNKSAVTALNAIKKRGYADKFNHSEKELIGIGMNFSSATKNIDKFKMKVLNA
jgi:hypothetical protein